MDIQEHPNGVTVKVKVQPRASRNRIVGPAGDALKVAVTAPAVDGAANQAFVEFLAASLKTPKNRISIVTGQTGRTKLVKVLGLSKGEFLNRLGIDPDGIGPAG